MKFVKVLRITEPSIYYANHSRYNAHTTCVYKRWFGFHDILVRKYMIVENFQYIIPGIEYGALICATPGKSIVFYKNLFIRYI